MFIKLGVAYNVWDGEELLQRSIESVRREAAHVVVVFQRVSNFGVECGAHVEAHLRRLQRAGLIDELVLWSVDNSRRAAARGDASIAAQFKCETAKRERGRRACAAAGCTHYIGMDSDEFYVPDALARLLAAARASTTPDAWRFTACRMRTLSWSACVELLPPDDVNCVPFICATRDVEHRLAARANVLIDPTRRLAAAKDAAATAAAATTNYRLLSRDTIEMWHMTLVRRRVRTKLSSVSNRGNLVRDTDAFIARFEQWRPDAAQSDEPPPHPHPVFALHFTHWQRVDDYFRMAHAFTEQCAQCEAREPCEHRKKVK